MGRKYALILAGTFAFSPYCFLYCGMSLVILILFIYLAKNVSLGIK